MSEGEDLQAGLERALELSYRHLGRRERTEAQLRRHLATREIRDATIDATVQELMRQGYLDDARYARVFTEDRRSLDGWGSARIENKLLAAGVDRELVVNTLGGRDPADELDAAVALLRRRYRELPATEREYERALALLVRKGYDLELAYDAVRAFARADAA